MTTFSRQKHAESGRQNIGALGTIVPQPATFDSLRHIVSTEFTPLQPLNCTFDFDLRDWVDVETYGDPDIKSYASVTGSATSAYMTTYELYLEKQWPGTGLLLLTALEAASKNGESSIDTVCLEYRNRQQDTGNLHDQLSVSIEHKDMDCVVSVIQCLTWLASTLRPAPSDCLSSSSALVQRIHNNLHISLTDLVAAKTDSSTSCWEPLLIPCIIASGFPAGIGSRGLELPFELMLDVADVLQRTDLKHSPKASRVHRAPSRKQAFYYTGVHSVLYPVAQSDDGKVIRWHFESADRVIVPDMKSLLRVKDFEELEQATTILGFTQKARMVLATEQRLSQYRTMGPPFVERESVTK